MACHSLSSCSGTIGEGRNSQRSCTGMVLELEEDEGRNGMTGKGSESAVAAHSPYAPLPHTCTHRRERAMTKIGVLRDIKARKGVAANEIARRAYLYVARNQTLPPQVRYQAQLQLNTFGRYTRPTTVKNRCTESGRGRGIMSEFGLCRARVSAGLCSLRLILTCIL